MDFVHYRMVHELPTFFSSNFDYSELEHHLAMTRDGEEKTKAARIIERVNLCQHHTFYQEKISETIEF
ncbi:DnaI [Staphylococcus aureus]|uniref:DnaI n=1 Tax=Staphylococcus aureus TaxID=1280 RepID=A0A380E2S2_STAAU|nr:DnaI [Staphylococcus aureus]